MISLLKSKPELKEKSKAYVISIAILSLLSIILLMLPVIVNILKNFSATESTSDVIYYLLRGLFGISLAIGTAVFLIKKDISASAIPCLFGFITVLFPLYDSVSALTNAHAIAQQMSMTVGYGPYLITIGEYLLYTLLCIFTFLYAIGKFKYTLIIMLLSVVGSLATLFTCIDKYVTYQIPIYEILSFGYTSIACLIPLLLVLSAKQNQNSTVTKYKAKRMR